MIFISMKLTNLFNEAITLDIKVGDTILGGKFKNKKIKVKEIGKNDKGDITINGKPLLRFRIIDQDETEEQK
jgi:hypothetical protein